MEVIKRRRSIRKFKPQKLNESQIKAMLEAAMNAPSAGNQQPWQFLVIQNPDTLTQMAELSEYSAMLAHSPSAIVVCGDLRKQKFEGFWVHDCSAATQNLLLQATHIGLGSVWLGVFPVKKRIEFIIKMFDLPHYIVPFAVIPVGYADEEKEPNNRYNPDNVHYEIW